MATLKELMGDKTRGDGRKFTLHQDQWFEPMFLDRGGEWSGVNQDGYCETFSEGEIYYWEECRLPKQTNKVKLYSPIYENLNNHGYYETHKRYTSNKKDFLETAHEKIVGWHEIEVEVDR